MGVLALGEGGGGAVVQGGAAAEIGGDLEEGVLDGGLGEPDVGDVGLEAADASGRG